MLAFILLVVWRWAFTRRASVPTHLVAVVIVRFREPRESLDWVAQLDVAHRIVINKGAAFQPDLDRGLFRVIEKPNIGREDWSYLDFLLHHALDVPADLFVLSQAELRDYAKTPSGAARWLSRLAHAPMPVCSSCYGHRVPFMEGFDDPPPRPFTTQPRSRLMCPAWPWERIAQTKFCPGETIAISRDLVRRLVGSPSAARHGASA